MKKITVLGLLLCAATSIDLHAADMEPTQLDIPLIETISAPTITLTTQYILLCVLEQVIPCETGRTSYLKKYQHLLNATLEKLQVTNPDAYYSLTTPIIQNQAGALSLDQAQTSIQDTLSDTLLAYQLFTGMQQQYVQELETSNQITEKTNVMLDKKYECMYRQLQISTIATIIVGYLQVSKLLGYKVWPLLRAHRINVTT